LYHGTEKSYKLKNVVYILKITMEFVGTSSHYNGEVIINIKDRGTGIDIDMDDKIFSKFATKSDTGSGLGCFTY
jgi:signal transduction histidine kinase